MASLTPTHTRKPELPRWTRLFVWGLCALVAAATLYTIGDVLINYALASGVLETLVYILDALLPLVCVLLATLIVLRQPRNAIGWLLFVPACAALVDVIGSLTVQKLPEAPPDPSLLFRLAMWLDKVNWLLLTFPFLFILVLFPTGRPPSPRWNWVVALALSMIAFNLSLDTFAQYWESPITTVEWRIVNPIGFIPNDVVDVVLGAPWLIALSILTAASLAALVWRYRRSELVEQTEIKWPLFASAVFGVVYVVYVIVVTPTQLDVTLLAEDLVSLLLSLASLAVPMAIGIAILRYRLWDIDVIIRRTLIYVPLTALLALVFFGGVAILQVLLGPMLGQSQVTTAFSTLATATVALPLRNRIQTVIDRRFYRQKYDAQRTLDALAARLQSQAEADVNGLAAEVTGAIRQTLQPSNVRVWLVEAQSGPPVSGKQAES